MEDGLLDEAPVFTNLEQFPWGAFSEVMGEGVLTFGWPCQPVSHAGQRKATQDERWLFDIIADGIAIMQPAVLFAENVEGLLTARMPDGTLVIRHCIERLERLRFRVEIGLFSAEECGAPHRRKRVFILAYREGFDFAGWVKQMENTNLDGDGPGETSKPKSPGRRVQPETAGGMADSRCSERGQNAGHENPEPRGSSSGESMADTMLVRQRESYDKECSIPRQNPREDIGRGSNEPSIELAHSAKPGSQGRQGIEGNDGDEPMAHPECPQGELDRAHERIRRIKQSVSPIYWPGFVARPGEPQHDWEPSRVALPSSLFDLWNRIRKNAPESIRAKIAEREKTEGFLQTLRKMGVRVDGCTTELDNDSNTDELRLLGNGIYPAAAVKAFLTLAEKLFNER